MAEKHEVVTKVWIAPGCIVCDSCENDAPEVFDVQEETCVIRPAAMNADFLKPLTPSVVTAAEGCPVDVIKYETVEVEGPAPWAGQEQPAAGAGAAPAHAAPVAKAPAPPGPPDPKWQALLSTSRISPSLSAGLASTMRRSPEINQAEEMVRAVGFRQADGQKGVDWRNAPPDQRAAILAAGGAYQPALGMGQRLRQASARAREGSRVTRRGFSIALAVAWGAMAATGLTFLGMFQDFFGPKVLREPKTTYRVGRMAEYTTPGVYEQFRPQQIWLVNLQPRENRLVALSTICTHLGCIPTWLGTQFKCPCHGSGFYMNGINFEGPAPRPLERHRIFRDPDGFIVVDKSRVYRQELGEWDDPESYVILV